MSLTNYVHYSNSDGIYTLVGCSIHFTTTTNFTTTATPQSSGLQFQQFGETGETLETDPSIQLTRRTRKWRLRMINRHCVSTFNIVDMSPVFLSMSEYCLLSKGLGFTASSFAHLQTSGKISQFLLIAYWPL